MQVGTGANILIAGFIFGGSTSETVLIRASGPALIPFGISGTLLDLVDFPAEPPREDAGAALELPLLPELALLRRGLLPGPKTQPHARFRASGIH